jgi:hypothetical protein
MHMYYSVSVTCIKNAALSADHIVTQYTSDTAMIPEEVEAASVRRPEQRNIDSKDIRRGSGGA